MNNWSVLVIIEIGLVFGAVLAWGGWELYTLRRDTRKALQKEELLRQSGAAQKAD